MRLHDRNDSHNVVPAQMLREVDRPNVIHEVASRHSLGEQDREVDRLPSHLHGVTEDSDRTHTHALVSLDECCTVRTERVVDDYLRLPTHLTPPPLARFDRGSVVETRSAPLRESPIPRLRVTD